MGLPVPTREDMPAVIDPTTGEVITLDGPTDQLALFIQNVRDVEQAFRESKRAVAAELHRRMDAEATWTVRAGDWEISGESPSRVEYDPTELHDRLTELLESDLITPRAMEDAIERVVTFKPKVRGINQLLKLGGVVREYVEKCQRPVERERRITIKRKDVR